MSSLMDKLKKSGSIKSAAILSESQFFNEKDQIPTDIPIINVALSGSPDGGLVPGLTFLAGPSKHFKSLLGLVMVKAYMKHHADAICLMYDSEFGITPEYIKSNGIDADRVLHIPIEHLEQLKFDIAKRLEDIQRGDHVVIFIDSVGNLASKKEVEDALDEKSVADMSRAKVMKSLWRIVTPHLTTKDIPCIAINHTYKEMCLAGDTLVSTPAGEVRIDQLKAGDEVVTCEGVYSLEWAGEVSPEDKEFIELTFDDGSVIKCTSDHRFLATTGEWKKAEEFEIGEQFADTSFKPVCLD